MLWRVLIAVVAVLCTYALIPPLSRIFGFDVSADVMTVVRVCVAGIAIYYILRGKYPA